MVMLSRLERALALFTRLSLAFELDPSDNLRQRVARLERAVEGRPCRDEGTSRGKWGQE